MNAAAWERIAELTAIGPGVSVLDVGCGTGRFCAFAAERGAAVHGIDLDATSLEEAMGRVPAADLRYGLFEDLPWADASFDVVTGFNTFQYALDIELALAEARRVARPGGRIAVCKWDRPEHNELFALLAEVSDRGIDLDRLPPSDPVEDAIARVQLDVALAGTIPVTVELTGDDALAGALERADAVVMADAAHLRVAASPYRQADGSYRFRNRLVYWIATRPRGTTAPANVAE
jgi:ubiquinone/menaquinone biosynthesis C-methylase UbiE